ncbi:RNA polymerase sigma-70 factor [Pedobacter sp. SYSU D00535]|uniref:RNA polymerase sigma-70 factor n=1 Tax=Pedobacter sp. SYSU D00535 TaxID=2810308 RepID=UPI001A97B84B|nr:RNA polymerase sigma-70 factor [Pedobacter sp. SYSU D00535]
MNDLKKLSDENLLEMLKEGHVSAFEELYNRYWSKLYASAYKRLKEKEVCEEIVQDFFTSLWLKRSTLVVHTGFSNYVYTAVRYLIFSHFHKEGIRKSYQDTLQVATTKHDNSTEETVAFNELNRLLRQGVEVLPEKCRAVYELSRKQNKNNKEISHLLGISEKTVENHMTKALRTLRLSVKDIMSVLLVSSIDLF